MGVPQTAFGTTASFYEQETSLCKDLALATRPDFIDCIAAPTHTMLTNAMTVWDISVGCRLHCSTDTHIHGCLHTPMDPVTERIALRLQVLHTSARVGPCSSSV